jgi:hypothetical protein
MVIRRGLPITYLDAARVKTMRNRRDVSPAHFGIAYAFTPSPVLPSPKSRQKLNRMLKKSNFAVIARSVSDEAISKCLIN